MLNILKDKNKLIIGLAMLWQLISIALIAVGVWPQLVAVLNLFLLAILFVILPRVNALGLFLLSLPFMIALPGVYISALVGMPMWRLLVIWLFIVALTKYTINLYKGSGKSRDFSISREIKTFWKDRLQIWDKWLLVLLGLGVLSLLVARYPAHGLKQIIFIINIYLLYLVYLLVVETSEQYKSLLHYLKSSLLITVLLGFVQYFLSLFYAPYYFWQYWATLVSSSYYGQSLAEVLSYSNSWFSADGGGQSLRMFGILQDTHAFSVIVIFALALFLAKSFSKEIFKSWKFWLGLTALCFAIIASGTRGVWLSMLSPAVVVIFLMIRYKVRVLALLPLISYGLVIILFVLSPFISMGLNWVRTVNSDDNFLERAGSIYDLDESSNVGRLEIWKSSLNYAINHPLGTGYGNFISSITDTQNESFEQVGDQKNLRFNLPQKFITAHSLYLHLLVELGLLGLIAFGAIWLGFFKKVWTYLKSVKFESTDQSQLLINIGLALIWLLAYGLFDVTILNERVLLYLMAIMAVVNFLLRNKQLTSSK